MSYLRNKNFGLLLQLLEWLGLMGMLIEKN